MDFGLIMYPGLFLFSIYIVAGASAYRAVLIANDDGVHIVNSISNQNKTVLPFEKGANSVGYDLETGYVYSVLKNNQQMQYRIVRTKVLETPGTHSCNQKELESWCGINKYCKQICNSSNPYNPEKVLEPYRCSRVNNLVLDWINHNIYWTCDPFRSLASTLNMATTEGLDNKTVLERTKPIQSVDIDPYEGKIFFLESNTLFSTNLGGKNMKTIYQFDINIEEITKISLDSQRKAIYVIGHTLENKDERFLASVNYDESSYVKHYSSKDPAWEFGPKVVDSVVYWLTLSSDSEWHSVGDSVAEENVTMEKISVPHAVNQWSFVHLESQKPLDGSYCRTRGCSNGCSLSQWMKITCRCPSGMALGADSRTCYENHVDTLEDISKATSMLENSTSSSVTKDNTKKDNGEVKSIKSSEVNSSKKNVSAHGKNTSLPEMARPESEITTGGTFVEPAVNGSRDLVQSAVDSSQNATETVGVVNASSSNMTPFYIVFTTTCIFIVVVVVRKRSKMGNWERTDFFL